MSELLTGVQFDSLVRKSCALPEEVCVKARELVVSHELPWPG